MEQQMTPWFVNGEKPARPGVYNVSCRKTDQTGHWWASWDGETWYVASRQVTQGPRGAETGARTSRPNFWHKYGSWRGLAQDPSAQT